MRTRQSAPSAPWFLAIGCILAAATAHAAEDFTHFESAHVHPVALSGDHRRLYAVNTPEGMLSMFDVAADGSLSLLAEVPVGVEPVSLAVNGEEVWVVNHVSDSISIVDTARHMVVASLATGDEPTDVLFAGGRAFVSQAGNRDHVRVYDAASRAEIAQIDVFGDDPRALAASNDGAEVYVVVLESGNRTAAIPLAADQQPPPPSPPMLAGLPPAPKTQLLCRYDPDDDQWEDEAGIARRAGSSLVVPDEDVFVIDTATLAVTRTIATVGTTLYDVAVHPLTGDLWVANTDARNHVRFEPNLRGHFVETRLTVVEAGSGALNHLELNPHIDFGVTPGPPEEIARSVAIPGDIAFSADGSVAYVAAFGSAKVAVVDTSDGSIERIEVGGGPSGLALAEDLGRLYVTNRFDQTISIVDTEAGNPVGTVGIAASNFDPSPDAVRNGRRLLYDAQASSGHGDSACASCHVFGNFDGIGWDLGDPTAAFVPYTEAEWVEFTQGRPFRTGFHPMKGPMVTQTLRGLEGMEPFHWRGDRRDFQHFNGAFVSLMGRADEIAPADMDLFSEFIMTVRLPPNPNRTLDDRLPPTVRVTQVDGFGSTIDADPHGGEELFLNGLDSQGRKSCVPCHALPAGTDNTLNSMLLQTQDFKIAQLRNVYEKAALARADFGAYGNLAAPRQKSAFGVLHGGAESLIEFLVAFFVGEGVSPRRQEQLQAFLMAFPSGTPPVIGRQVTLGHVDALTPQADADVALLLDQAAAGNCDIVVKGVIGGEARSFVYDPGTDTHRPDSRHEAAWSDAALRTSLVDGDVVTYTALPAGSGRRAAVDRDRDSWLDADELADGTDPADPESTPAACRGRIVDNLDAAVLKLKGRGSANGSVTVRGEVDLSDAAEPPVDPAASGLTVEIRDAEDAVLFRRFVEARSWSLRGGAWRLRDTNGRNRGMLRSSYGRLRVALRSDGADLPGEGISYPLRLVVLFGRADQDALDQCSRCEFQTSDCRESRGNTVCNGAR